MKKYISIMFVLLFVFAALPLGVLAADNDYRYATEPVNMRTGPGTQYNVIRELQTGEQVEYLNRSGKWAKVKSGDTEGYVFAKYLTREKPITTGTVLTAKGTVNIRSKASTASAKLGKLKKGDAVTVVAVHGKWLEIKFDTGTAFVYKKYFKQAKAHDVAVQYVRDVQDFFTANYKNVYMGLYIGSDKLGVRVSSSANIDKISAELKASGKVDMSYIDILPSKMPFYANGEYMSSITHNMLTKYLGLPKNQRDIIRLSAANYDPQSDMIIVEIVNLDEKAQRAFEQYIMKADYISFHSADAFDVPQT
jgi:uncharacterized protein YgiM (DUF1202 family)